MLSDFVHLVATDRVCRVRDQDCLPTHLDPTTSMPSETRTGFMYRTPNVAGTGLQACFPSKHKLPPAFDTNPKTGAGRLRDRGSTSQRHASRFSPSCASPREKAKRRGPFRRFLESSFTVEPPQKQPLAAKKQEKAPRRTRSAALCLASHAPQRRCITHVLPTCSARNARDLYTCFACLPPPLFVGRLYGAHRGWSGGR